MLEQTPAILRAKFRVNGVSPVKNGEEETIAESIALGAVYSDDPNDPNHAWSKATPSGNLSMYINNPGAFGFFKPGEEYFLDFSPAQVAPLPFEEGEPTP